MDSEIKQISAELRYIEEIKYPKQWSFRTHYHDCFHLFFIRESTGAFLVNGRQIICNRGEALIIPPGMDHGLIKENTEAPLVVEILFDVYDKYLYDGLVKRGIKVQLDNTSIELINSTASIGFSRKDEYKRCAQYFLCALLAQICITREELDPFFLNKQFIDMDGFSYITKAIIIFVDKNYKLHISLDDIARELGYSKSYLCTVFKKDCYVTIYDYVNLVRIYHVAEYLSFSEQDISYMCQQCGFGSVSHFNRTFKKYLGISPSTYKRMRPPHFNMSILEGENSQNSEVRKKLKTIVERTGTIHNTPRISMKQTIRVPDKK